MSIYFHAIDHASLYRKQVKQYNNKYYFHAVYEKEINAIVMLRN